MKSKTVTGVLALILGVFGVHRFYLGQKGYGVLYFLGFFFGLMITVASDGDVPFIVAPAILGFIDAILFLVMPQTEFDDKYNSPKSKSKPQRFASEGYRGARKSNVKNQNKPNTVVNDPHKRIGIEKFRSFDYLGAIEAFQKSLQNNYESPSTHFNLACAYSMLELPKDSYFHLEKAVEFGFDAFEKIESHQALAYLRIQPDFNSFIKNNYKVPGALPMSASPMSDEPVEKLELKEMPKEEESLDLLDQLMQLGELMEKGLLSEAEFNKQKEKLLRD